MILSARTKRLVVHIGAPLILTGFLLYLFFQHTSTGRLLGLYAVAGFHAPLSVRASCIDTSRARVVQKFTLPLDIYGTARTALREYWHYAYMRECLFVAGYSFLGRSIPESTILSLSDTTAQFTNSIAGVEMTVPIQTAILADNVLNVEFDYRLYRSTLMIGTSTLFFDTYTNHEDIHNFKELILRPELLLSEGVTLIHQESHVDSRGLEYLRIEDTSGQCGVARATPWEGLVYIHAPCDTYPLLDPVAQSLTFLPKPVSVHS